MLRLIQTWMRNFCIEACLLQPAGKTHPDTLALCSDSYRNVYSCHCPVRLYKQCYKCQHHKYTHKAAKQCQRSITVYHRHIKNYCRSNYSYQKTNHDYLPFSHKLSAVLQPLVSHLSLKALIRVILSPWYLARFCALSHPQIQKPHQMV